MLTIFHALVFLPILLGLVVYVLAAGYALCANHDECTRIERCARRRVEASFRITGRTYTTAAQVRALRESLPLPVAPAKRFTGLRAAPSANEAVTVPDVNVAAIFASAQGGV